MNQINILLAGVGVAVVIYTFAVTFLASNPTDLIWVEPGAPVADFESPGRRLSGSDTSVAFRGSTTGSNSAVEMLPMERARRPGFQTSQPGADAGPRAGFMRSVPGQGAAELNRVEVGRSGGVVPMTPEEQFGQPEPASPQPSRIGEMNSPLEPQQPQPVEDAKRDASTDPPPPPPPIRSSNRE